MDASVTVCIIGSGFSGLAAAHRLRRSGISDVVILERASAVGGTWRDNVYPGCACDIPAHLYSLSFAQNADWSRTYAPQAEIQQYVESTYRALGVDSMVVFGANVVQAAFDPETGHWVVACEDGRRWHARFLISAVGALKDPKFPDVPGREQFAGEQIHTARWPKELSLRGKRVGLVGTGASAVQVLPAVAAEAGEVHVFQRSPAWVIPRLDRPYFAAERWLFGALPLLMRGYRWWLLALQEVRYYVAFRRVGLLSRMFRALLMRRLRREVLDDELRRKLEPRYAPGCKRLLISSDWFPALQRPNVSVHASAVQCLDNGAVHTASGVSVPVDIIIWCTGYRVDAPLAGLDVIGLGGRLLTDVWGKRPSAYLGVSVPSFPNAFLLLGPNTALGHNSVLLMIEAQVGYAVKAIAHTLRGEGHRWLDVRPDRAASFVAEVDERIGEQVWQSGCQSWYLNDAGENFTIWPGSALEYMWRMRRFDAADYDVGGQAP